MLEWSSILKLAAKNIEYKIASRYGGPEKIKAIEFSVLCRRKEGGIYYPEVQPCAVQLTSGAWKPVDVGMWGGGMEASQFIEVLENEIKNKGVKENG